MTWLSHLIQLNSWIYFLYFLTIHFSINEIVKLTTAPAAAKTMVFIISAE